MTNYVNDQRKILQEKLLEEISDYDYRFTRYKISYSLAIAYTPEPTELTSLLPHIRKSDRFIPLNDHFHAVVFDFTDEEKAIKASNKLLTFFQYTYFSKSIFASVITADNHRTPDRMIAKLFDLVVYSIRHNLDNHIMDQSQIMKGM